MKNQAATRTIQTYLPRVDLRRRYPDWKIKPAPAGVLGDRWVSFNVCLKIIAISSDPGVDRDFAVAFAVALLDSGEVAEGMTGISPEAEEDAEDVATMRLGPGPTFDLDVVPTDGPPSITL